MYIKSVQQEGKTKITFYSTLESSNVLRFSYVESVTEEKEGDTIVEKPDVYLVIEYSILAEQAYPIPLKAGKRVKQTKTEEYFIYEQVERMTRPLAQRVTDPEEIQRIIQYAEKNLI